MCKIKFIRKKKIRCKKGEAERWTMAVHMHLPFFHTGGLFCLD